MFECCVVLEDEFDVMLLWWYLGDVVVVDCDGFGVWLVEVGYGV